jgi:hypothetical protein
MAAAAIEAADEDTYVRHEADDEEEDDEDLVRTGSSPGSDDDIVSDTESQKGDPHAHRLPAGWSAHYDGGS